MTDDARMALQVLREYRHIDKRTREIMERIERCRDEAMRATASMTVARTSGSGERSRVETAVVRMVDIQTQLGDALTLSSERRERIQDTINQIEPVELRRLLEMRYIDGSQWERINTQMHISRTTSYRMHIAALEWFWGIWAAEKSEHHETS